jgi:hypothetical protein
MGKGAQAFGVPLTLAEANNEADAILVDDRM